MPCTGNNGWRRSPRLSRADRGARRRHGHDDPAAQARGGGLPRRALRATGRATSRATTTCSSLTRPDLIAEHPRSLPGGRRRHHRDQHLQLDAHLARPTTAWRRSSASSTSPGAARAPGGRRAGPRRTPASRASSPARSARPTAPPRCRRTSNDPGFRNISFDELAEAYREAARGSDRRRRRPASCRDDLRHAERQGGAVRDRRAVRAAGRRAAGDDLRHDHRSLAGARSRGRPPRRSGIRCGMRVRCRSA